MVPGLCDDCRAAGNLFGSTAFYTRILEKIENDIDGDMSLVIGKVFDWHINDFNKPD